MSTYVRVLDLLHELRTAGVAVDRAKLVEDPVAFWGSIDHDQRATLFRRLQIDSASDGPTRVRLVARRGRATSIDDVFVEIAPPSPPGAFRRTRDALRFKALSDADGMDLAIPAFFAHAGGHAATGSALAVLDAAWGGEPYDVERDGAFCAVHVAEGHDEVERYAVADPFAAVSIQRDAEGREAYCIVEPHLTELERSLAATVNERLRDLLVRDVDKAAPDSPRRLAEVLFELLRIYRADLDRRSAYRLGYHLLRDYTGFGRLDVLMRDPHIEDISCNGPSLPVYVVHSRHQNIATDLVFEEVELNSFTIKLAQRGGKLLSVAQPLVDATLPGGSRIQASLGREITSRGSAFTIRKFREDPLTAVDLILGKTHSFESMAFLWLVAEMRRNLVVMGATASGKTTTLNCISQFIPPSVKVVTIEDTREITLQHENWLAAITRDGFSASEAEKITMYDLLRAALRQRPEYIIVGEIRGVEGLTLFQAMSTGHTCFSTMHAGSVENAVYRLENAPIGVPRVMLTSLDLLLLQGQVEVDGKPVRRMLSLTEIDGLDPSTRNLRTNEVFRWDPERDAVDLVTASTILEQARLKRGWSRSQLRHELDQRAAVLEGLVRRRARSYRDVAKAVREFYEAQAVHV